MDQIQQHASLLSTINGINFDNISCFDVGSNVLKNSRFEAHPDVNTHDLYRIFNKRRPICKVKSAANKKTYIHWFSSLILLYGSQKAFLCFKRIGLTIIDSRPYVYGSNTEIVYLVNYKSEKYLVETGARAGNVLSIISLRDSKLAVFFHRNNQGSANRLDFYKRFQAYIRNNNATNLMQNDLGNPPEVVLCEGIVAHIGRALTGTYPCLRLFIEADQTNEFSIAIFEHSFSSEASYKSKKVYNTTLPGHSIISLFGNQNMLFLRTNSSIIVDEQQYRHFFNLDTINQESNFSNIPNDAICRPSCIINLRQHSRKAENLDRSAFLSLVTQLRTVIPDLIIYLDGITSFTYRDFKSKKEFEMLQLELDFYKRLQWDIPGVFITSGMTLPQKLFLFRTSYLSIQAYGSGPFVPYLLSIDTIIIASYTHSLNHKIQNEVFGGSIPSFSIEVISPVAPNKNEEAKLSKIPLSSIKSNPDVLALGTYEENFVVDLQYLERSAKSTLLRSSTLCPLELKLKKYCS